VLGFTSFSESPFSNTGSVLANAFISTVLTSLTAGSLSSTGLANTISPAVTIQTSTSALGFSAKANQDISSVSLTVSLNNLANVFGKANPVIPSANGSFIAGSLAGTGIANIVTGTVTVTVNSSDVIPSADANTTLSTNFALVVADDISANGLANLTLPSNSALFSNTAPTASGEANLIIVADSAVVSVNDLGFSAEANSILSDLVLDIQENSITAFGKASTTLASNNLTFGQLLGTTASGVTFDYVPFSDSYDRDRVVYVLKAADNNTVYIMQDNKTVYVPQINRVTTNHVIETNTTVYVPKTNRFNTVYV